MAGSQARLASLWPAPVSQVTAKKLAELLHLWAELSFKFPPELETHRWTRCVIAIEVNQAVEQAPKHRNRNNPKHPAEKVFWGISQ